MEHYKNRVRLLGEKHTDTVTSTTIITSSVTEAEQLESCYTKAVEDLEILLFGNTHINESSGMQECLFTVLETKKELAYS